MNDVIESIKKPSLDENLTINIQQKQKCFIHFIAWTSPPTAGCSVNMNLTRENNWVKVKILYVWPSDLSQNIWCWNGLILKN